VRKSSLLLLIFLLTLTGCVVTYRDFPHVDPLPSLYEPATQPRCRQTVQFSGELAGGSTYGWTYPYKEPPAWRVSLLSVLEEALQNYGGCSNTPPVVFSSKWAQAEVVVSVREKPYPWYSHALYAISSGFFMLIPVYSGQGGWKLSYSFYDRNELKKTYKYEITPKRFSWLLLLPFSWINFFTYSLEEAVRSTTAQFIVDAQRDGYLGTAN
jgi:hypothetical protein